MKSLSNVGADAPADGSAAISATSKRVAQLEQLSLLRESNATLRDESQKNYERFKQEKSKLRELESKLASMQAAGTGLNAMVEALKAEIESLKASNARWKQRVDQLVKRNSQMDPAEHEKVCAERTALQKEAAELNAQHAALKTA